MKASIIVPLYHSHMYVSDLGADLQRTVQSLPGDNLAEIVWVSDGDGDYGGWPRSQLASLFVNRYQRGGFSCACNSGAALATGDVIVLLNADTRLEERWLHELLAPFSKDVQIGIVAPAVFRGDRCTLSSLGSQWSEERGEWAHVGEGLQHHPSLVIRQLLDRDMVTFACVAIRKSLWDSIGGLDEGYAPAYWEDADFCMEARRRHQRIVVNPRSRIYHFMGRSGEGYGPGWQANRDRYFKKWIETGKQKAIVEAGLE